MLVGEQPRSPVEIEVLVAAGVEPAERGRELADESGLGRVETRIEHAARDHASAEGKA